MQKINSQDTQDAMVSGEENHVRIGIDIGGTFTDLMVIDLLNMQMYETKVPSTPPNLLIGIKMVSTRS